MPLPAPKLDTRTWAELTAETRSLLPRFAPEWTDYNVHDPGITLVELFAWLTELQLFQVDRVTPALRRAYLRLAGVVPRPATVAGTVVAVRAAAGSPSVALPTGTQIADGAGGTVFETTGELTVARAWLDLGGQTTGSGLIVSETGSGRLDLTELNVGERAFEPLGPDPRPGDALLLGFEQPPIPVDGELSLYFWTDSGATDTDTARRLAEEWWAVEDDCRAAPTGPWPTRTACEEHRHPAVSPDVAGPASLSLTCATKELRAALRVLATRAPIRGSTRLLLQAVDDSLLLSSNDAEWSRARLPASVVTEGEVILPGRLLASAVRLLPDGALTLTYDGGSVVTLTHGSAVHDLQAYRADDRPWLAHYGARTEWDAWDGASWTPLATVVDETRSLTLSGQVRLAGVSSHAVGPGDSRYWLRCRLVEGGYDCPPRLRAIAANAVPVRHAATQTTRELGESLGGPSELHFLESSPIVSGSTEVHVVKGRNVTPDGTWHELAEWDETGPDDRHYRLDSRTGTIEFGDGRVGRVPFHGSKVRAVRYEVGGGTAGNVRARTLARLEPVRPGIAEIVQPFAAVGGSEAESLDQALGRALECLDSATRGVTASDLEQLALETPGVPIGRAIALPGRHPDFPCLSAPGVVTVVVLPACGDRPEPSEAMLGEVARYLERRRPVTTELHVVGPEYVGVELSVTLHVAHAAGDVRTDAQAALDRFFRPLPDAQDVGWPLGRDVLESEVLAVLAAVPGVEFADELLITVTTDDVHAGRASSPAVAGHRARGPCGCRAVSDSSPVSSAGTGRSALCGNLALCGIQLVDSRAHQLRVVKE